MPITKSSWHSPAARPSSRPRGNRASAKTSTKKGLKTTVDVLAGDYPLKEGYPVENPDTTKIRFDEELPAWNYRAIPHDSDRPVMRRGISVALDTGEVVGTSFV